MPKASPLPHLVETAKFEDFETKNGKFFAIFKFSPRKGFVPDLIGLLERSCIPTFKIGKIGF